MSTNDSDAAWQELQKAVQLPNLPDDQQTEKLTRQEAASALAAAEKARTFYTRFPGNPNALEARKLECKMLETAFFDGYDKEVFARWAAAQLTLLGDPTLTDADRFQVRVAILARKRFDRWSDPDTLEIEREKDIRQLIRDFPDEDKPRRMLLRYAAILPEEKARSIANELLTPPAPEAIQTEAKGILRRLDAVGKPLDIQFTALDGRQVDLSQMKGKVVLVDFWATWCGPCVGEIPHVKEAYRQFHSQGFEVIGISFDSSFDSGRQKLQRFIQQEDMPWPQYFDGNVWNNKFAIQYGIAAIPTMWLVDKKGNLRETFAREDLTGKVQKLLDEDE